MNNDWRPISNRIDTLDELGELDQAGRSSRRRYDTTGMPWRQNTKCERRRKLEELEDSQIVRWIALKDSPGGSPERVAQNRKFWPV